MRKQHIKKMSVFKKMTHPISHQPKDQIAESTQQRAIQHLLISQKNFRFSHTESVAENFLFFISDNEKSSFEVSF